MRQPLSADFRISIFKPERERLLPVFLFLEIGKFSEKARNLFPVLVEKEVD